MGIHSSHRLGTVWISATCETCKKPIPLEFLCFLLILPYYGNSIFPCFWNLLQFPRFLFHTKYLKDPWFLNVCVFPYFSRTMRIRFSYVLGTVWIFASCKVWKKALDFRMFCFPILFSYYRNSFFPCFGDNTTDEKTNKILFTKEVILLCCWARPNICISDPFVIDVWKYLQCRRVETVFYGSASVAIFLWI